MEFLVLMTALPVVSREDVPQWMNPTGHGLILANTADRVILSADIAQRMERNLQLMPFDLSTVESRDR